VPNYVHPVIEKVTATKKRYSIKNLSNKTFSKILFLIISFQQANQYQLFFADSIGINYSRVWTLALDLRGTAKAK
jgi:hypothetical protein